MIDFMCWMCWCNQLLKSIFPVRQVLIKLAKEMKQWLTFPPCSGVHFYWIFIQSNKMSNEKLRQFTSLMDGGGGMSSTSAAKTSAFDSSVAASSSPETKISSATPIRRTVNSKLHRQRKMSFPAAVSSSSTLGPGTNFSTASSTYANLVRKCYSFKSWFTHSTIER